MTPPRHVRHPVVVELLGPPASGKSGLAEGLARLPGVEVLKDHRRHDLPDLGLSMVRSWRVALAASRPDGGRARRAAWVARLGAAPAVVRRRGDRGARTVVLDQGPAYTLGRLAEVRRTSAGMSWWLTQSEDCAALLDLLVLLDADREILTRRLRQRPKRHRADDLADEQADAYLREEQATCRLVADALEKAGTPVLRLDTGHTSPAAQLAAVQDALERSTTRSTPR